MKKSIKLENDKICKERLSHKRVLAILIKTFIPEFKNVDYESIEKCIIGYNKNKNTIKSYKSKDTLIKNGYVYYDLLYKVKYPESKETFDLIINIEPQGNSNTGYPIAFRGLYYASRLLATQRVTKKRYSKLKKVYSIWICADKNTKEKSYVSLFEVVKNDLLGKYNIKRDYRLINVVMITIGKDINQIFKRNDEFSYIFKLISLLIVNNNVSNESRVKSLETDYDIIISKEDIDNMHWSNDIEESGFNRGLSKGKKLGLSQGMAQGMYQGELSASKKYIEAIMSSLNVDFDKAAELLKISDDDKSKVLKEMNISSSN